MNVIIIGGTGLIGYHASHTLLAEDHKVTIVSRGSINHVENFPSAINSIVTNVFNLDSPALIALFEGFDTMVYALGPDDRELPPKPALDFFKSKLVDASFRVCSAAKQGGVKSIVVLNSYFTYFNRVSPAWNLAAQHPYIACRVEQAKQCLSLSDNSLKVIVLEIPYVFGTMPQRDPLWKEQLLARLKIFKPFMVFTKGGTAMTSVGYMAAAISGAIQYGKTGSYIVGEQNMSWREMLLIAANALGGYNKRIITIPTFIAQCYGYYQKFILSIKGKEAGLDYPKYIKKVQSRCTYFPEELMEQTANDLKLRRGSVRQAMKETFIKCDQ